MADGQLFVATDVQLFIAVFVLFVTVAGIVFSVMRPTRHVRHEPPKPVPLAMREQVRRDVQAYRRRTGGNDAA